MAQDGRIDELLLVAGGGLAGVMRNGLGDAPRQRAIAGMGQENLLPRDGKLMLAQVFVLSSSADSSPKLR